MSAQGDVTHFNSVVCRTTAYKKTGRYDRSRNRIFIHKLQGRYTTEFSRRDCMLFQKYRACIIDVAPDSRISAHTLFLTMDAHTDMCNIFDSNGSLGRTYESFMSKEDLIELCNDLNSGLLDALSTSSAGLSVAFQNNARGLQSIENAYRRTFAQTLADPTKFPGLFGIDKQTSQRLLQFFLNAPDVKEHGFCLTWAMFRFIDHIKNNQMLYKLCENAFVYNDTEVRRQFLLRGREVWFQSFVDGLNCTSEDAQYRLFNHALIHIFIRCLTSHFVLCAQKMIYIDNQRIWPNIDASTSKVTSIDVMLKFISNHLKENNIDIKYSQKFWVLGRNLGSAHPADLHLFPFGPYVFERTAARIDLPIWQCTTSHTHNIDNTPQNKRART